MTRDFFHSTALRVLMDNDIEPRRAVTIAAVLEQKVFGIPNPPMDCECDPADGCGYRWRGPVATQNGLTVCPKCGGLAIIERPLPGDLGAMIFDTARAMNAELARTFQHP